VNSLPGATGTGLVGAVGRPAGAGSRRQRNARGQGSKLTAEIVDAALALIDRTGTAESVTLRAVAREIGIAAPSIYSHFQDRDAILLAVFARLFDELTAAIQEAVNSAPADPVERLVVGCEEYVRWGLHNSARYSVLFETRWAEIGRAEEYCKPVAIAPGWQPVSGFGVEAFAQLVEAVAACVQAGVSASTDVVGTATALWVALHGTVTLRTTLPRFPWPQPVGEFVRELVLPLAQVTSRS
jgi:AcrR family transcriptional regulator